jgi:hypothetical protein
MDLGEWTHRLPAALSLLGPEEDFLSSSYYWHENIYTLFHQDVVYMEQNITTNSGGVSFVSTSNLSPNKKGAP